jgi:hypothetical protein
MKTKILIILIIAVFIQNVTFAHSGRTNKSGCHTNHKTGDYHCH